MSSIKNTQRTYAFSVIVSLILVGIGFILYSFNSDGNPQVDLLQGVLHISGGLIGFYLIRKNISRLYNTLVGIVSGVLAGLWFLPHTTSFMSQFFAVDLVVTIFHIGLSAIAFIVVLFGKNVTSERIVIKYRLVDFIASILLIAGLILAFLPPQAYIVSGNQFGLADTPYAVHVTQGILISTLAVAIILNNNKKEMFGFSK